MHAAEAIKELKKIRKFTAFISGVEGRLAV